MNTRIALSGLSIIASFALMTGAAYAFFTSSATSTGNAFASGNLTLQVNGPSGSPAPTVSATFTGTNMAPGGSTSGFVSLDNTGSINIDHVTLHVTENSGNGLANVLQVTKADLAADANCVSTVNLLPAWETDFGHPTPTLAQMISAGEFSALPGPNFLSVGETKYLCLTLTMDPNADNTYQGKSTTDTFSFTGKQDSTQLP